MLLEDSPVGVVIVGCVFVLVVTLCILLYFKELEKAKRDTPTDLLLRWITSLKENEQSWKKETSKSSVTECLTIESEECVQTRQKIAQIETKLSSYLQSMCQHSLSAELEAHQLTSIVGMEKNSKHIFEIKIKISPS